MSRESEVSHPSICWITIIDVMNQLFVQFYDFMVRIKSRTKVRRSGQLRVHSKAPYLAAKGLEVLG